MTLVTWYLGVGGGLTTVGSVWLVRRWAHRRCSLGVRVLVALAWLLAASTGLLVPLAAELSASTDQSVWTTLYWVSFVLMWFGLPLASGYYNVDNGAWGWRGRLRVALVANARLLAVMALLGACAAVYLHVADRVSWTGLLGWAMAASNVWGLVTFVCLAGFGLVDVPRRLWHARRVSRRRDQICLAATRGAHDRLEETRDDVRQTLAALEDKLETGGRSVHLEQLCAVCRDLLVLLVPVATTLGRPGMFDQRQQDAARLLALGDDDATYVQIHSYVRRLGRDALCAAAHWAALQREYVVLERVVGGDTSMRAWTMRISRCLVAPLCACLAASLSLVLVWSELVLPIDARTSVLAVLMASSAANGAAALVPVSLALVYLTWCTCVPLFTVDIPGVYAGACHHGSDESALLVAATTVLRMATPLAYNFVLLLDADATKLASFIGPVRIVPFFGDSFTRIFPWCLLLVAGLSLGRTWARIGRMLGMANDNDYAIFDATDADVIRADTAHGQRLLMART
jgi:hypothetical protein